MKFSLVKINRILLIAFLTVGPPDRSFGDSSHIRQFIENNDYQGLKKYFETVPTDSKDLNQIFNGPDRGEATPLCLAIKQTSMTGMNGTLIVDLLLRKGANPNIVLNAGKRYLPARALVCNMHPKARIAQNLILNSQSIDPFDQFLNEKFKKFPTGNLFFAAENHFSDAFKHLLRIARSKKSAHEVKKFLNAREYAKEGDGWNLYIEANIVHAVLDVQTPYFFSYLEPYMDQAKSLGLKVPHFDAAEFYSSKSSILKELKASGADLLLPAVRSESFIKKYLMTDDDKPMFSPAIFPTLHISLASAFRPGGFWGHGMYDTDYDHKRYNTDYRRIYGGRGLLFWKGYLEYIESLPGIGIPPLESCRCERVGSRFPLWVLTTTGVPKSNLIGDALWGSDSQSECENLIRFANFCEQKNISEEKSLAWVYMGNKKSAAISEKIVCQTNGRVNSQTCRKALDDCEKKIGTRNLQDQFCALSPFDFKITD